MSLRIGWVAVALVAVAALSACQEVKADERVFKSESSVTATEGDDEHKLVTMTQKGIDQIGLETAKVTGSDKEKVIPYSALLYAADGEHAYVYFSPEPRTFKRHDVTILKVDEDRVLISDGPPVGSDVVSQGAAQVHGAELEFGKY